MQRDRLPYILLPLAALIAVLPLILHGCSCGHDFDFHILNWLEAARQFRPEAPFIHMSTNKVYGDLPNSLPLVELGQRSIRLRRLCSHIDF